jgi:3-(methylthio)propanoyl-CoA dehydrogenase
MANFYTDNKDLRFHLTHPLMEKIVRLKERNFEEKKKYDFAPMDYEDALDSFDKVLEVVGEICGDIISPNAESIDAEGPQVVDGHVIYARGTEENIDALRKAGLMGMSLAAQIRRTELPDCTVHHGCRYCFACRCRFCEYLGTSGLC